MSLIEKWKKEFPKGMDLRILLRVEQDLRKTIDEVFEKLAKEDRHYRGTGFIKGWMVQQELKKEIFGF